MRNKHSVKQATRLILSITAILVLAGCAEDKTAAIQAGQCVQLKSNCAIDQSSRDADFVLTVGLIQGNSADKIPASLADYHSEIARKGYSFLPRGTKIRIDKLAFNGQTTGDSYLAFGKMLSGPLAGKSVVLLSFVHGNLEGGSPISELADPGFFEKCDDVPNPP